MSDFYELLEVPRDADKEAIRKAYRKKAMTMHPDQGGNEEEFKELALAKRVLMDDEERDFYDRTGQVKGGNNIANRAAQLVVDAIRDMLDTLGDGIFWENPVQVVVGACKRQQKETDERIKKHEKRTKYLKKVLAKFKRKKQDVRPFLEEAFGAMIRAEQQSVGSLEKHKLILEAAEQLVTQYEFDGGDKEARPLVTAQNLTTRWATGWV